MFRITVCDESCRISVRNFDRNIEENLCVSILCPRTSRLTVITTSTILRWVTRIEHFVVHGTSQGPRIESFVIGTVVIILLLFLIILILSIS